MWASALSILRAEVSVHGRSEALGERTPSSIISARRRLSSASFPLTGDEMKLRNNLDYLERVIQELAGHTEI